MRKKAVEDAYMLIGIPKIPKKKPFRWDKKCARWAGRIMGFKEEIPCRKK